ncbi:heavy-metal-associated domain-containing protein [Tunicatimonas pelagia]|uniref:heavy-metal-associated domain-containing protein n=1 Tax=Tunicatimonas pelagia TaxID=931531 RepID=UPI0026663D35|nr:heavy-metal-associated domain-containing protein [Tunicatimonas pelagia]WKN43555.1 heavy-metal-associated domain-containing protein [Tunicatimonas pelagia]
MKTHTFKTNINCGSCVRAVTPHLNQVTSVESWEVDTDHPDKVLTVEMQSGSAHDVVEAVEKAGFSAQVFN